MLLTEHKDEIIDRIKIAIEDMQCDIKNELTGEDEAQDIKLDIDSLKTVLGHLITLKTS